MRISVAAISKRLRRSGAVLKTPWERSFASVRSPFSAVFALPRRGSPILCPFPGISSLLLALSVPLTATQAASTQPTITGTHRIYANIAPHEQLRATSTFDCGFYNSLSDNCTLSWTLAYVSLDPGLQSFSATWDSGGINLTATLGISARSRTWNSEVINSRDLANPARIMPGPIRFSGVDGLPNTSAETDYYQHPKQSAPKKPDDKGVFESIKDLLNAVGDAIDLGNSIVENPTLATFNSKVTLIGASTYEYLYEVANLTDTPLLFNWTDTGHSGSVDPNDVLTWSVVTGETPYAVYGSMDANVKGGDFAGPSSTILPASAVPGSVPLPSPLALLAAALVLMGINVRPRRTPRAE